MHVNLCVCMYVHHVLAASVVRSHKFGYFIFDCEHQPVISKHGLTLQLFLCDIPVFYSRCFLHQWPSKTSEYKTGVRALLPSSV